MERALVAYPAIARGMVELFEARFDPALGEARPTRAARLDAIEQQTRDGARRASRRSTRTASCGASSTPCAAACAPITGSQRGQGLDLLQDRQPHDRRAAAAAAAGRDLRLQPAHGRHPSARRPGGARRHPLVRPARGFPHRDPGPDEGADGEERRHRAGRLEGRLLRQARRRSNGTREQIQAEGIDCYQTLMRGLLDITDNYVDGKVAPPADVRAPRRRRSLSRGRRRQGHGHLLRHRQCVSRANTASGWTTPSPPAARPATTTRRWASPRAAPGNR